MSNKINISKAQNIGMIIGKEESIKTDDLLHYFGQNHCSHFCYVHSCGAAMNKINILNRCVSESGVGLKPSVTLKWGLLVVLKAGSAGR
ncbi:hypothetical protein CEXT_293081 [Caerostris extrusa]|uniref:Uncharacterized protein n=1 Tax=Caerostris extrusa TaxID=172846 RepID=A0AAV4WKA0_CAEEX|nr:hypothetical protein CEXT_293081 [Caerostris extrusa]